MSTLAIKVEEVSDATGFKLYDETIWDAAYDYTNLITAIVTVTYDGTDYTLDLLNPDIITGAADFINIFGTSCSSYVEISPAVLLDGTSNPLAAERFVDGYYLIKLDIVYDTESTTVTAGSFVTDTEYIIKTIGTTDFTLIGASANTVGLLFTATGAGTGTGDAYEYPSLTDTSSQGFIAHAECRATVAPLEINIDNYDYQYNRTLFLLITQLPSAKYAASLGRVTQFDTIMDRIVAFLDASSINKCW